MKKFGVTLCFIMAALALPATADTAPEPAWAPSDGTEISFTVLRKGKPLGTHIVSFERSGDQLKAIVDVDLKVKIGPFTAFKYTLDATEVRTDGRLVSLTGKTNDNGDKHFVDASLCGSEICVRGSEADSNAPLDIIASSHWDIDQIRSSQMLSSESGAIIDMTVEPLGRSAVTVGDQSVPANHYRLMSDIEVDLWYDDAGRWLKLAFEARGETIEYRLDRLY